MERVEVIQQDLINRGLAPKYQKPGVYYIKVQGLVVYVGKSRDMLKRLAEHIEAIERNDRCNKYKVLHKLWEAGYQIQFDVLFYSEKQEQDEIDREIGIEEGKYIRQYLPSLNYQIPKEEDYKRYTVNKRAKTITWLDILEDLRKCQP